MLADNICRQLGEPGVDVKVGFVRQVTDMKELVHVLETYAHEMASLKVTKRLMWPISSGMLTGRVVVEDMVCRLVCRLQDVDGLLFAGCRNWRMRSRGRLSMLNPLPCFNLVPFALTLSLNIFPTPLLTNPMENHMLQKIT